MTMNVEAHRAARRARLEAAALAAGLTTDEITALDDHDLAARTCDRLNQRPTGSAVEWILARY